MMFNIKYISISVNIYIRGYVESMLVKVEEAMRNNGQVHYTHYGKHKVLPIIFARK